ncbi:GNAT family N-acetyltransferase [Arenibaculum sp.]|uniref:GNAT family N-acetyltransferase n=1 Tax=Arenibaculum sp. TaxID=2865862 RepID=UPI002E1048A4|nr:GNAT family N-acetyltransferase [Arenibaculum sp.]
MSFAVRMREEPDPLDPSALAERHASAAFLNALMRDWAGWRLLPAAEARRFDPAGRPVAAFPMARSGITVHAILARRSLAGRHGFALPLLAEGPGLPPGAAIGLDRFARLVAAEPAIVGVLSDAARDAFLRRVGESRANIAVALAERGPADGTVDFADAEQALLLGHPVHPTPKSRDGFSAEDAHAYAPEHGGAFPLAWFAVHRSAASVATTAPDPDALVRRPALDDPQLGACFLERALPGPDWTLLPQHPWQAERLLRLPEVAGLVADGRLRPLGTAGSPWRATTSLRTLHAPHAAHMLKFSLGVRLTNSTRVLQAREVDRGLRVDRILDGPLGRELAARFPDFRVMREPAHLSLLAASGPVAASTVVLRDNPFRGPGPFEACVLATLCQDDPFGGEGLLARVVRGAAAREGTDAGAAALSWFDRFLAVALEPLLVAQADYGLLFSAHQQNVVLGLAGGWPAVLHFRDCQGTGFTGLGRDLVAQAHPELAGDLDNVFDDATTARLVGYYLVVNAVFGVVTALAVAGLAPERLLLDRLRDALERLLSRGLRDPSAVRWLLESPQLWSKANFRLGAGGVEETLADGNPAGAYVPMPNPLAAAPVLDLRRPGAGEPADLAARLAAVFEERPGTDRVLLDADPAALPPSLVHGNDAQTGLPMCRRAGLLQVPLLWHGPRPPAAFPYLLVPCIHGGTHPLRPPAPRGLVYERFVREVGATLSLRTIDPVADLDLFHGWMNQGRVAYFWELAKPKPELAEYLETLDADPHAYALIGSLDGEPGCYFEVYWAKEDRLGAHYEADDWDRGWHFLVGNPRHLGRARTIAWFRAINHYLFLDEPRTRAVVGEPRASHVKMLQHASAAGFDKVKEFDFPHKRAALMRCERDRFFEEILR